MKRLVIACATTLTFAALFWFTIIPHETKVTLGTDQEGARIWNPVSHQMRFPAGEYNFSGEKYFEVQKGKDIYRATYDEKSQHYLSNASLNGEYSISETAQVWATDQRSVTINVLPQYQFWLYIVIMVVLSVLFGYLAWLWVH